MQRDPWVDAAVEGGVEALHRDDATSGLPRNTALDAFLEEQRALARDPNPLAAKEAIFFDPELHRRAETLRRVYLKGSVALFKNNSARLQRMAAAPAIYPEGAGYAAIALLVVTNGWVIESTGKDEPDVDAISGSDLRACTWTAAKIRANLANQTKLAVIAAPTPAEKAPKSRKDPKKPSAKVDAPAVAIDTAGYEASLIGATLISLDDYWQLSLGDYDEAPKYREGAHYLLQDARAALNGWLRSWTTDSVLSGGIETDVLVAYLGEVQDAGPDAMILAETRINAFASAFTGKTSGGGLADKFEAGSVFARNAATYPGTSVMTPSLHPGDLYNIASRLGGDETVRNAEIRRIANWYLRVLNVKSLPAFHAKDAKDHVGLAFGPSWEAREAFVPWLVARYANAAQAGDATLTGVDVLHALTESDGNPPQRSDAFCLGRVSALYATRGFSPTNYDRLVPARFYYRGNVGDKFRRLAAALAEDAASETESATEDGTAPPQTNPVEEKIKERLIAQKDTGQSAVKLATFDGEVRGSLEPTDTFVPPEYLEAWANARLQRWEGDQATESSFFPLADYGRLADTPPGPGTDAPDRLSTGAPNRYYRPTDVQFVRTNAGVVLYVAQPYTLRAADVVTGDPARAIAARFAIDPNDTEEVEQLSRRVRLDCAASACVVGTQVEVFRPVSPQVITSANNLYANLISDRTRLFLFLMNNNYTRFKPSGIDTIPALTHFYGSAWHMEIWPEGYPTWASLVQSDRAVSAAEWQALGRPLDSEGDPEFTLGDLGVILGISTRDGEAASTTNLVLPEQVQLLSTQFVGQSTALTQGAVIKHAGGLVSAIREDLRRSQYKAAYRADFLGWLAQNESARDGIVAAYQRVFLSYQTPDYDYRGGVDGAPQASGLSPVLSDEIVRLSPLYKTPEAALLPKDTDALRAHLNGLVPKITPYAYQSGGARRLVREQGGLLAFDVGVGKTLCALLALGQARQEGKAQRPVICVPDSLVGKWEQDVREHFPTFRAVSIGTKMELGVKVPSRGRYAQMQRELAPLLIHAAEGRIATALMNDKNGKILLGLVDADPTDDDDFSRVVRYAIKRQTGSGASFKTGAHASVKVESAFACAGFSDLTNTDPMMGDPLAVTVTRKHITDRVEAMLLSGLPESNNLGVLALQAQMQASAAALAQAEAEAIIVRGTQFWAEAGITLEGVREDGPSTVLDYAPMGMIQVKQKAEEQVTAWEDFRKGRYDVALCGHSAFTSGSPLRLNPSFVQEHTARTRPLLTQVEQDAGQASPIKSTIGRLTQEREVMRWRKEVEVGLGGLGSAQGPHSIYINEYMEPIYAVNSAPAPLTDAAFKLPSSANPTQGLILFPDNIRNKMVTRGDDGEGYNTGANPRVPGLKWMYARDFQPVGSDGYRLSVWQVLVRRGIGRAAIRSKEVAYADITFPNSPRPLTRRSSAHDPLDIAPVDPGFNLGLAFNGSSTYVPLWEVWGGPELRWAGPYATQSDRSEAFDALGAVANPGSPGGTATELVGTTGGLNQTGSAWWLSDETTGEAMLLTSVGKSRVAMSQDVTPRQIFRFPAGSCGDPDYGYIGPYAGLKFTRTTVQTPWKAGLTAPLLSPEAFTGPTGNRSAVAPFVSTSKISIEDLFRGYTGTLPTLKASPAPARQQVTAGIDLYTMGPRPLLAGQTLEDYLLATEKRMLDPNAAFRQAAVLAWAQAYTSGKRNAVDGAAKEVYFNTVRFPANYSADLDTFSPQLMAQAATFGIPMPNAPVAYSGAHYDGPDSIRQSYDLGAFPFPGLIVDSKGDTQLAAPAGEPHGAAFSTGLVLRHVEARYPDNVVISKSQGALIPMLYRCNRALLIAAGEALDAMRDALAVAVGTHKWNKTGGITRKANQTVANYARATVGTDPITGKDVLIPVYEGSGALEDSGAFRSVIVAEPPLPGASDVLIYAPWAAAVLSWLAGNSRDARHWHNAQGVDLDVRAAFTDLATARGVYAWQPEHTHEILSARNQEYLAVPAYVLRSPKEMSGAGSGAIKDFGGQKGATNPLFRGIETRTDRQSPAELFSARMSRIPKPRAVGSTSGKSLWFGDVGIDMLIVDEAHNFKALFAPGKRGSLGGGEVESLTLGATSKSAVEMEFRAARVRSPQDGGTGSVYLLTATPASTSPVEFYNILHYLGDGKSTAFDQVGIRDQEEFISRYIEVGEDYVAKPGVDPQLRLAAKRFRTSTLNEFQSVFGRYGNRKTANDSPFLAGTKLVGSVGHDEGAEWGNTEQDGIPFGVFYPSTGAAFPTQDWGELMQDQPQGLRLRLDGRIGGDYRVVAYGNHTDTDTGAEKPWVMLAQIFPKATIEPLPTDKTQVEANGYSSAQGSQFTWGLFKGARVPGAVIQEVVLGMSPIQQGRYNAYSGLLGGGAEGGTGSLLHRLTNASMHLAMDIYNLKSAAVALETAESEDDAAKSAKGANEADRVLFSTFFSLALRTGPVYPGGPTWEEITPITKESGDFFESVAVKELAVPRTDGLSVRFVKEAIFDASGVSTEVDTMVIPAPDVPPMDMLLPGQIYSALYTNPMFAVYGKRALMEICLSFHVAGLKPDKKGNKYKDAGGYVVNFRGYLEASVFHTELRGLRQRVIEQAETSTATSFLALSQNYTAFAGNLLGGLGKNVPYAKTDYGTVVGDGTDYAFVPALPDPALALWLTPDGATTLRSRSTHSAHDLAAFADYWDHGADQSKDVVRRAINFLRIEALARVLLSNRKALLGATKLRFVDKTTAFLDDPSVANDANVSFAALPEGPALVRAARRRVAQLEAARAQGRGRGQVGAFVRSLTGAPA